MRDDRDLNYYYLLEAFSPVNRTGSPQGFSNLTQVELPGKHAHYTNVKHKHNPKVSPFGIALVKMARLKNTHELQYSIYNVMMTIIININN